MKNLIANFPQQLKEAIQIGESAKLTPSKVNISNVLICGLGGSGIGGTIVSELVAKISKIPITVSKGYFIPNFVNENTLVILSSYSGNTEETLNCLSLAKEKNAKITIITSGGKLGKEAKFNHLDSIIVPDGMPPRACLGYSLTQLFFVLGFHSIIDETYKKDLKSAVNLIESKQESIKKEAELITEKIKGKTPVIYSTTYNEGIAVRFRQQLNENAKILCWHHVIPEMNHNELVGWTIPNDNLSVIFFLDKDEYSRNLARVKIIKKVIEKYAIVTEIYSKGDSAIEKAIYFIHLGDWVSSMLAEYRKVDAVEVNVINHLKSELSKI